MTYSSDDINAMARTIYGEARGESWAGKIGVGWVIRNRADNPRWWGESVQDVCQKPFQFSAWNKKDPNRVKMLTVKPSSEAFKECLAAAAAVLGGVEKDSTGRADHYHTIHITAQWSEGKEASAVLGDHIFYRLEL